MKLIKKPYYNYDYNQLLSVLLSAWGYTRYFTLNSHTNPEKKYHYFPHFTDETGAQNG